MSKLWNVCHCLDPTTLYRARTEYQSEFDRFWNSQPAGEKQKKILIKIKYVLWSLFPNAVFDKKNYKANKNVPCR